MLISTWDGDEYSFGSYVEVMRKVNENLKEFTTLKEKFSKKLNATLDKFPIRVKHLKNGLGYFEGDIPTSMAKLFKTSGRGFIVCPNKSSMEEFLNE